jgi:photosystem II stability/assembly factor-like uncharacterized protein
VIRFDKKALQSRSLSNVLAIWIFFLAGLPTQAAPRSGPDRPFSINWRIVAPPAPHLRAATIAPGKGNAIAVGDGGLILHSTDRGKSWGKAKTHPYAQSNLLAVLLNSALQGNAVGDDGTVLFTSDGGATWERAITPTGVSASLRAIAFSSQQTGVTVGSAETVLYTEDGGKSWQQAKLPTGIETGNFHAVTLRHEGTGLAVGSGEVILRTEDNGKTWSRATTPSAEVRVNLKAVTFLNSTTAITSGTSREERRSMGAELPILRTVDGGKTWARAKFPTGIAADVRAMAIDDLNTAIIVGSGANVWHSPDKTASSAASFGAAIMATDDGGETWTRIVLAPAVGQSSLYDIVFTGSKTALAVGNSQILHTADGGKNWQKAETPDAIKFPLQKIVFSDSKNGIAIGDTESIAWTEDGGLNWIRSKLPAGTETSVLRVVASKSQNNWLSAGDSGTILGTSDRGEHWERMLTPSDFTSNIYSMTFFSPGGGVATGSDTTILRTEDSGKTWERAKLPVGIRSDLRAAAFANGSPNGVSVGSAGTILRTQDGGKNWDISKVPDGKKPNLHAVAFFGDSIVVAVGESGTILRSDDGGKAWNPAKAPPGFLANLKIVRYTGGTNAIAAGDKIVRTVDGGRTWELAATPPEAGSIDALAFAGPSNGVAVGTGGSSKGIVWTEDGGKTWQLAKTTSTKDSPETGLRAVVLNGTSTGIAVGANGLMLGTRDGGKTWSRTTVFSDTTSIDFFDVAFDAATGLSIAVGTRGTRIKSETPNYAPYIDRSESSAQQGLDGKIELDLQIVDEESDTSNVAGVEFNVVRKDRLPDWKPLRTLPIKSEKDGHWRIRWSPSDDLIGDGATIEHRVFLADGGSALAAITLNPVVYRSFLDRISDYKATIWTTASVLALVALYLIPIGLLYWLAPARLALAGSGTLDAVGAAAEGGTAISKAIASVLRQLALPWFKRRLRVRTAWLSAYNGRTTRFDKLSKEVREQFLLEDDVLDAWVARRLPAVRQGLAQLPLFRARRTYIPFPVRVGDAATGDAIDQPGPTSFQAIFRNERAIVSIIGGGGSGKTTLACALARWALADEVSSRLQSHWMIPIFVAEDTENLLATVTSGLSRMMGAEEELEADIVRALLRRKRVLVVVDALSERSVETQRHLHQLYGSDSPINALIITTRRDPDFGPIERTALYPQPIDLRLLVPFIMEYLKRKELTDRFEPRQQLALAQRILQIVEAGGGLTVTPLLVTLFVDTAVARAAMLRQIEELPVDVPEVYLDYLDRLNPSDVTTPNRIERETMQKAAFVLARTSLGKDYVPADFRREGAEKDLGQAKLAPAGSLIDRLISNGVVQERAVAGIRILRFQLDPVAEYLDAIATCRELGGASAAWEKTISELTALKAYPDGIRGFLTAITVCYASYKAPLKLASIIFPWEHATDAPRPGA